ncbi:hypothetical protein WA016_00200 [Myxococcus stipitatus]
MGGRVVSSCSDGAAALDSRASSRGADSVLTAASGFGPARPGRTSPSGSTFSDARGSVADSGVLPRAVVEACSPCDASMMPAASSISDSLVSPSPGTSLSACDGSGRTVLASIQGSVVDAGVLVLSCASASSEESARLAVVSGASRYATEGSASMELEVDSSGFAGCARGPPVSDRDSESDSEVEGSSSVRGGDSRADTSSDGSVACSVLSELASSLMDSGSESACTPVEDSRSLRATDEPWGCFEATSTSEVVCSIPAVVDPSDSEMEGRLAAIADANTLCLATSLSGMLLVSDAAKSVEAGVSTMRSSVGDDAADRAPSSCTDANTDETRTSSSTRGANASATTVDPPTSASVPSDAGWRSPFALSSTWPSPTEPDTRRPALAALSSAT